MNYFVIAPQVMGVINLSPDSFSSKGQYLLCEKAAENAYALAQAGASAIDMGAVATNATIQALISPQEEQERLFPLLKKLSLWREKPWISIDTPHEETAIKAIEAFDVDIINFAGKKLSRELVNAVKSHNKKIILTHHLTIPVTKNTVLASTTSIIDLLQEWGNDQIEAAERLGLAKEQLILDPGIGFGKTAQQNLLIIKEAARLKQSIKSALCFGISRKMKSISATPSNERDPQSTFLGSLVASQGIEWIRVHNVKMQMELLVASQAIALASYHEED